MSLKAMHILFVMMSTLLSAGFGLWAIRHYQLQHTAGLLVVAAGSFIFAGLLIAYGIWFMRKLKHISFM